MIFVFSSTILSFLFSGDTQIVSAENHIENTCKYHKQYQIDPPLESPQFLELQRTLQFYILDKSLPPPLKMDAAEIL